MKIAFVTSSLSPGRDGVGDYTSGLAEECSRRGHEVVQLSLNDAETVHVPDQGLLRLGNELSWKTRVVKGREFLTQFAPDVVSLQFVCYGFHPRGISFRMAGRLRQVIGERPVQIMFHDLWVGDELHASIKDRIIGELQRMSVLRLFLTLEIRVVHTSNAAYVHRLRSYGVPASRLPLFGAIPTVPGLEPSKPPVRKFRLGFFGTLHPAWRPEPMFSYLRQLNKDVTISHIGRIGPGEALWRKISEDYALDFDFERLGEQPSARIAEHFAHLDFGIATIPWAIVGKSAGVAAMLDHGLPVIVSRNDVKYRGLPDVFPDSPLLIKMDEHLPERILHARRGQPAPRLPEVTTQFLNDLRVI